MTRTKVIQIWFAAVLLVGVTATALGETVTISTAALLLAMCLVPPAVVFMLWPSDAPPTMADAKHDANAR